MNLSEKGIIIRRTIEQDLPQIYSMGKDEPLFKDLPFKMTPENLADIYALEDTLSFSVVRKKRVLGFIIASAEKGESRVHWMMVTKTFRRAGIGGELLKLYLEISKKKESSVFLIAVFRNNPESVKFFTKNGFAFKEDFVELIRKDD